MIKIVGTTCQGSIKVAEFLERFEKKKKLPESHQREQRHSMLAMPSRI